MPRAANTASELWSKVDIGSADECWPWKGWRNEKGYGRTEIRDVTYYAHRVIFDLANPGQIQLANKDRSQCVLHRCDNPPCCNPAHLFIGTHDDNMQDKKLKGRASRSKHRAKLSSDDVQWIRLQKSAGATKKALALLYEVSEATISGCLYGRYYTEVV